MATFGYLTFGAAKAALASRLADPTFSHWTDTECGLYLIEALREWNALTQTWVYDWTTSLSPSNGLWQRTDGVGSPRERTGQMGDLVALIQAHLLETPEGIQFTPTDYRNAFTQRRDEVLQTAATNVQPLDPAISLPPGESRVALPDGVLDVRRVRFVPAAEVNSLPTTLYREDSQGMEYFDPLWNQTANDPFSYSVIGAGPQTLTFDSMAVSPNTLDILAIMNGTGDGLGVPDDFGWVLKWGVIAELLAKESEGTDAGRAAYAEGRYREGLRLMAEMPWLLQARVVNLPVDTPSVTEADDFSREWVENEQMPMVVRGGVDLFALSGPPTSVTLSLVGNAPVPVADSDPIQVSRDVLDALLSEAHHLAAFKLGGSDFKSTENLHQEFVEMAMMTNRRLRESGIFATDLRPTESRESIANPRFALKEG